MAREPEVQSNASGFKLIGEMTREELIEELSDRQRRVLEQHGTDQLRAFIVSSRMEEVKERLMKEAGLKEVGGLFGGLVSNDSED